MKERLTILCALVLWDLLIQAPILKADQLTLEFSGKKQAPIGNYITGKYVPGELLVKFKEETPRSKIRALHSSLGVKEARRIKPLRVRRIKLTPDSSIEAAINHYKGDPNVEYAEPNYIIRFMATMPDDTDFQKLWGLHNTGQEVNGVTGTGDADIDAPEAWDVTTGSGEVVVAITDSGVAYQHPELDDHTHSNIWVNSAEQNGTSGFDDDGNGYVDDIYGWDFWDDDGIPDDYHNHGTPIAGTIASLGNNGAAITGVNWNVKIMSLRIGGVVGTVADAAEAFIYAVDNGAHIINASWSGPDYSRTEYDALNYANDHGVLLVAAAGNGGDDGLGDDNDQTPEYPASYSLSNIISVAATDQDDSLAEFSNYGINSVHVAAPGVNIYSTIPETTYGAKEELYTEGFGPDTPNWVSGGTNDYWAFTSRGFAGYCLEDSPDGDYFNNTESFAGYGVPFTSLKKNRYTLSFKRKMDLGDDGDILALIGSEDGENWFLPDADLINLGNYRTGTTNGVFIDDAFNLTALADVHPSFYFGFYLYTNESISSEGVYLDNLSLYREPINISGHSYDFRGGTSMASSHVAGVAALVKAQNPNYAHSQIRDAILNTVDEKDSLEGKLFTEGRVNAFKAVTYLAAPTNVKATPGDRVALLTWNANSERALTGYKVLYGMTQALGLQEDVGDVTTYEVSGLANGDRYYFAVRAIADFADIGPPKEADSAIVTAAPSDIPIAPSSLSATTISTSQIDLSWKDNYYGEQGFKIERKTGSEDNFTHINEVGENRTTYGDTDITEENTYYYRVRAYSSAGNSDYSNVANATTSSASSDAGNGSTGEFGESSCFITAVGYE